MANAVHLYPSDSYMIFLGDAFITDKVDASLVDKIIEYFINSQYEYCCLRPKHAVAKEKKINSMFRNINTKDRYSHSFISFLASREFLEKEFCSEKEKNDRDFEMKYLNMANDDTLEYYFDKHIILLKDVFSIKPGIEKGQWNRRVLRILKKKYPDIRFTDREKISLKWQMMLSARNMVAPVISNDLRRSLKKLLSKGKDTKFDTDT